MTAVTRAVQGQRDLTPTQEAHELRKAQHGTRVHEACYKYGSKDLTPQDLQEIQQLPTLVQMALAEYRRLMATDPTLQNLSIARTETELHGYIAGRYLAGSADITGRIVDDMTIADIKTEAATGTDNRVKTSIRAQLSAYAELAETMYGITVRHLIIIELCPGHAGRVIEMLRTPHDKLTTYIRENNIRNLNEID